MSDSDDDGASGSDQLVVLAGLAFLAAILTCLAELFKTHPDCCACQSRPSCAMVVFILSLYTLVHILVSVIWIYAT